MDWLMDLSKPQSDRTFLLQVETTKQKKVSGAFLAIWVVIRDSLCYT